MRELWFLFAILASIGGAFTDDPEIRVVTLIIAMSFWFTFAAAQQGRENHRYGRLMEAKPQSDKDA